MLAIGKSKYYFHKPQIQTTKRFTYAVTGPIFMSQFINNVVVIGKIVQFFVYHGNIFAFS